MFDDDPDVLFVSCHGAGGYPCTGGAGEVGRGAGEGATINVPLPADAGACVCMSGGDVCWCASLPCSCSPALPHPPTLAIWPCCCLPAHPPTRPPAPAGQEALLATLEEVVEPAARRFLPDILLVSAGYDAHWRDPLGGAVPAQCDTAAGSLADSGLCLCADNPCLESSQSNCRAAACRPTFPCLPPTLITTLIRSPLPLPPSPAGLQFRTATYHALGARLKALADELCGGRLVMLLEGGYDLKALGESVANTWLGGWAGGVGWARGAGGWGWTAAAMPVQLLLCSQRMDARQAALFCSCHAA